MNSALDRIGTDKGITRPTGMSNPDYANLINAYIQAQKSCGEPERIISLLKALGATTINYNEVYPAGIVIQLAGLTINTTLYNLVYPLIAGGVSLLFLPTSEYLFQFDANAPNSLDSGLLL